ncbi:MAG: hypothetical protein WBL74_07555 [Novosphingobium sp.]|uniref:hypothetical protein n=1 Tax=Novosphingobium sp. TaxID=1874826 RepID=UPI003C7D4ABC
MTSLSKISKLLSIFTALAAGAMAGTAQAATCGVNGSATATPAVYDPFNPSGLATTNITLNLTRVNTSGGGDTREVNLYLKANTATGSRADGTTITPLSVAGSASIAGIGQNIFYNFAAPPPIYAPASLLPAGSNRFLHINFTGNNAGSDTAQVTFQVSLPANLDLNAVQSLAFDAFFACNIQGGKDNGLEQTGSFSNAVVFPVTVLSALRTYFAGTALDFGEIGNITTGTLGTTPKLTGSSNYVFVQSSGAYSVTLSSQNGFKLFRPGAATNADKVNYQLRFLGRNVDPTTNPTPGAIAITRSCQRATLSATGNTLPIQAKLLEGGSGKTPSPSYSDILTITVTPLIYTNTGTSACGAYSLDDD